MALQLFRIYGINEIDNDENESKYELIERKHTHTYTHTHKQTNKHRTNQRNEKIEQNKQNEPDVVVYFVLNLDTWG